MDHRVLREEACRANRDLARLSLVVLAFGNASVLDRELGVVAIKPSGIACDELEPGDIVVVDLVSGERVGGDEKHGPGAYYGQPAPLGISR